MKQLILVPVKIRPHLVKYLMDRFPTHAEAVYCGKRVKSVKIKTNSPLGRYIRSMMVKADVPEKATNFNFFFSVEENCAKGSVYSYQSGKYSFLKFPQEFIEDLNELLEDMFRMAFFYFVEGYRMTGKFGDRKEAIRLFIDKYELYEYGFNLDILEKQYTRLKGENSEWSPLVSKSR